MLEVTSILHLIKPKDLNHHGTLFAGQMAKWLVEAGLIAASRLIGKPGDIVCVRLDSMIFKKPVKNGNLVEIKSRIAFLGTSSITVHSQVFLKNDTVPLVSSMATFVTVDRHNRPYGHGFKLSEEYIAENRDIYTEALNGREAK